MMTLTPEGREALRTALSAEFAADLADEFDDRFLDAVADAQSGYIKGTAADWGWNDTEVREKVCDTAVELLGLTLPEDPRSNRSVFTQPEASRSDDEAEMAAYYAAHDQFIEDARRAHAAWLRRHHTN